MAKQLPAGLVTRPRKRGNRFKIHWTPEAVLDAIRRWEEEHDEAPRRTDWDPTRCEKLAEAAGTKQDEWRRRATLFRLGEWPSVRTVVELFDSWNNAIEQAGFKPRQPSQRTPRGTTPSEFLTPLGHAMNAAYEAEDIGDAETLRVRLLQVANIAQKLAAELEADEDAIAKAMA